MLKRNLLRALQSLIETLNCLTVDFIKDCLLKMLKTVLCADNNFVEFNYAESPKTS